MASLEARSGHAPAALALAQQTLARRPNLLAAEKLQVALLRHAGQNAEARKRLDQALSLHPRESFLRLESVRLGGKDDDLWPHLAADSERVLDLADTYLNFGLYTDALELLSRQYEAVPANQTEPGATLPQENALVSYYRGYCQLKLGHDAAADFKLAATQRLEYVFPHRASSLAVLAAALQKTPGDASAHFLTGLLYLNQDRPVEAIGEFKAALAIRKDIPALHYALGKTLLLFSDKRAEGIAILQQGAALNPSDKTLNAAIAAALHPASAPSAAPTNSAPPSAPPAAAAKSAPTAPALKSTSSSTEQAMQALLKTANGDAGAPGIFNQRNFPQEKQPEIVRRAYIEVQLQMLRRTAAKRDCASAMTSLETLGEEDKNLPFTLQGFDTFMKGARFQYFLGAVESLCGNVKSAKSRWGKVAKIAPDIESADFAFPAVAAQSLSRDGKSIDLTPWLDKVDAALKAATESKGVLYYSKGILLAAKGDDRGAIAAFTAGVKEPDRDFSQYLNQSALAEASRAAK
jgi:tetratricopeptide (TPR) repeat protein